MDKELHQSDRMQMLVGETAADLPAAGEERATTRCRPTRRRPDWTSAEFSCQRVHGSRI
jgi:hypothetical protein